MNDDVQKCLVLITDILFKRQVYSRVIPDKVYLRYGHRMVVLKQVRRTSSSVGAGVPSEVSFIDFLYS